MAHSSMTWFTFSPEAEKSLIMNHSTEVHDDLDTGGKVSIDIDQHSAVSTFATVTKMQENNSENSLEAKDLRDGISVLSNTSYETRMTSMEQQMEEMNEKLDKKLSATTQVLQKSMFDFIEQMSKLKSSVFTEQETNSIKSDKSGTDNSAGSKRPVVSEDMENSNTEKDMIGGRRKSPRISSISQQNSQIGITETKEKSLVVISKPGEAVTSSGKT